LDRNQFNSVRLPVAISNILKNTPPREGLVNVAANRALNLKNFMTTLQSIIQALGYRQITVLISLHTLTPQESGGLWYNSDISQADFLTAVDLLTKNLCNNNYWNVIGLDLKNEPHQATWGDGSPSDWKVGAKTIGDRMLSQCPQWLAFVEGINKLKNTATIDGQVMEYADWWGGGLSSVAQTGPVQFKVEEKLVWAPHYYTVVSHMSNYHICMHVLHRWAYIWVYIYMFMIGNENRGILLKMGMNVFTYVLSRKTMSPFFNISLVLTIYEDTYISLIDPTLYTFAYEPCFLYSIL
jgi:endoglucanase